MRSEFRLKQGLERIDWEEDVLLPEIEAYKSGKSVLGMPAGSAFDIKVEHVAQVQDGSKAADPNTAADNATRSEN